MSDLSRRSLAKGAAWTVPAVTIAAAAPALAASPTPTDCPAAAGWRSIGASLPTWSVAVAPGGGSRVLLNIGDLSPSLNAPVGATGFRWVPESVTATDTTGATYSGTIQTSTNTAYTLGAGGALSTSVNFGGFAYNVPGDGDADWTQAHHLTSYAITYRVQWLKGLTTVQECTYTSCVQMATHGLAFLTGRLSVFS